MYPDEGSEVCRCVRRDGGQTEGVNVQENRSEGVQRTEDKAWEKLCQGEIEGGRGLVFSRSPKMYFTTNNTE